MKPHVGVFVAVGLLIASAVMATVPNTMNVQGRLLNAGNPMSGSHPATFRIYDAATGGALLWTENSSLTVQGGIFTAIIGSTTPIPTIVFASQSRWLEVTVDGTTLTPRLQLTTNGYAFRSQHADTANFALSAPSANVNLWSTDGTNVYRLTGKVGVATSTPDQDLGINGMIGVYPKAWVQPTTRGMFMWHGSNPSDGGSIYAYDYTAGHGNPIGMSGSNVGFSTYGADGLYSGVHLFVQQDGNVGVGTMSPLYNLDVHSTDPTHGLNWTVDGGTENGSFVRFGSNNSRGAVILGNPTPAGGGPADEAAILQTTGGWQWTKQLNIMGNVGINTNNPTSTLYVNGSFTASGMKCRAVEGTKYGTLYFNAVESGTADFTDRGEGLLVNGPCHVELNPKWLAGVTIDDTHPMQVTITAYYGPHGGQEHVQRAKTGFTLIDPSGSNAMFGWRVEAHQKGYEDRYLDRPEPTAAK